MPGQMSALLSKRHIAHIQDAYGFPSKPLNGESLIECLEMALIGGDTRQPPL